MSDDARTWIDRFATALGVDPPDDLQLEALLALAGVAAHASERTAAPVSCWIAAVAGVAPDEALRHAQALAADLADSSGDAPAAGGAPPA
jgi:hypothetical protein